MIGERDRQQAKEFVWANTNITALVSTSTNMSQCTDNNIRTGGGDVSSPLLQRHPAANRVCSSQRHKQTAAKWPGLISLSSHKYGDEYFDDNYYVAFRKCNYNMSVPAVPHAQGDYSGNSSANRKVSRAISGNSLDDNSNERVARITSLSTSSAKRSFTFSGFETSSVTITKVLKRQQRTNNGSPV